MLFQVSWLMLCVFTVVPGLHVPVPVLPGLHVRRQLFQHRGYDPFNVAPEGSVPYLISSRIGMAFVPEENRYYFLQHGPFQDTAAIAAEVSFDEANEKIGISLSPPIIPMLQKDGSVYSFDSEGFDPAAVEYNEGLFYWLNSARPQVLVSLLSGEFSNELSVPEYHKAQFDENKDQTIGIAGGRGYHAAGLVYQEGAAPRLDVMPVGPLVQDSAAPSVKNPAAVPVRITQFSLPEAPAERLAVSEFVYMLGPLPEGFDKIFIQDLVSFGEDESLVLESYRDNTDEANPRFMSQVFRIQYNPPEPAPMATDVLGQKSISGRVVVNPENEEVPDSPVYPVSKELVYKIDENLLGDGSIVDLLSYMVFGPEFKEGGGRLLYVGSDNENLPDPRVFQLLAFRFVGKVLD